MHGVRINGIQFVTSAPLVDLEKQKQGKKSKNLFIHGGLKRIRLFQMKLLNYFPSFETLSFDLT